MYHKHNACVPESRYKNLGEFISYHIYRNSRKHTLFSIQITIFALTSFLGGLRNGRYEMHQPNVNRPFLSIPICIFLLFHCILYYWFCFICLFLHRLQIQIRILWIVHQWNKTMIAYKTILYKSEEWCILNFYRIPECVFS